ncbi:iron-containing redox enzyme family protein [Anabaena sphaerica FACHB-251]|uniref:Iron-containing redox enzyme family protein n=1 Tax=Anabaena sphaerica FACHB-251 TaxID=2692883 RepID=A0A926WIP3_9NOST|nr:iron-containing redox enzyme family protein [Anabaena sphaerica]MBD2295152.1 iron-containing redox enzyme family protein [Anabaena sphaerica FACHB-251]
MKFTASLCEEIKNNWLTTLPKMLFWEAITKEKIDRYAYICYLLTTRSYTMRSALIQCSTISHFQFHHRNLVRPFLRHAYEEESHYILAENDLLKLGLNRETIEKFPVLPATEGYIGFIFNRIQNVSPYCYFGYLLQLEFMTINIGSTALEKIRKSLPNMELGEQFLEVHIKEDLEHVDDLTTLIEQTVRQEDKRMKEDIRYTALTANSLWILMMENAYQFSQTQEFRQLIRTT